MLRERLLPWSAFLLGGAGWMLSSQWGAMRVSDGCVTARPWQTVGLGVLGLVLALGGAALSWQGLGAARTPTPKFIGRLSLSADCAFILAILFHTIATLLIPRCFS